MSNQSAQSNQIVETVPDYRFKPGNNAQMQHATRHASPQTRYIRKLQLAMDMAVDKLGQRMQTTGADACAELISQALQADIVGTLHKLQFFMPKNINVDVQVTRDHAELTDAELEALIAERRAIASTVQGALIDQVPQAVDSQVQDVEYIEIVDSKDA